MIQRKNSKITLITLDEKREVEAKLEELILVKRKEVIERLKIARSYGDLSENSEYEAAKEEQAFIENEIDYLNHFLRYVEVIDVNKFDENVVSIGKTVTIYFSDEDKEETYSLVGNGSNIFKNKISIECPVGQAIKNREVGDEVIVHAPKGDYKIKILKIVKTKK